MAVTDILRFGNAGSQFHSKSLIVHFFNSAVEHADATPAQTVSSLFIFYDDKPGVSNITVPQIPFAPATSPTREREK
jgi:hypothetical protein